VRRNLRGFGFSRKRRSLVTDFKMAVVLFFVVGLSVFINTINLHHLVEDVNETTGVDLVTSQVVITDEGLTGLLNLRGVGELLSSEEAGEGIETVILVMGLTNLNGIISKVVVDDERSVVLSAIETEHLSIVIQELLLRSDLASSEFLLEILEHEGITLRRDRDLRLVKAITGAFLSSSARLSTFLKESSRVIIAIINAENAAVNGNISADREVGGHEGLLRSVTLEDHVALKESSLRNTRVGLLGLSNHDRLIFKVVEDNGLANSEVFKS